MRNKVYKRFPIKLWDSDCAACCMECEKPEKCSGSCIKKNVTCNQCEHGKEDENE